MKPTLKIVHPAPGASETQLACPSCNAPARDHFCSHCGEATVAHSPTAGEFIHEFIGHYVALEGKLWQTLKLLLFRPGQLTVDFMRGRRVPYINPLRLYLTLSLVVFGMIKLFGVDLPQFNFDDKSIGLYYTHQVPNPANPARSRTAEMFIRATESTNDEIAAMIARLGQVSGTWVKNAREFMDEPAEKKAGIINHGFMANLPYMLIGALPLFALYLKLIQWRARRHYGEHLVFALHVSSFAFLLASVMILIPGNLGWLIACVWKGLFTLISAWDALQLLPVIWIVAYLPAALRRVYGGSRWAAWVKSLVLMSVHLLVILALVVGAEAIAILKHA